MDGFGFGCGLIPTWQVLRMGLHGFGVCIGLIWWFRGSALRLSIRWGVGGSVDQAHNINRCPRQLGRALASACSMLCAIASASC